MCILAEKNKKFFMNCRLSIIVPSYNSEATLPMCLDSIKLQLTDDVEVIVVDDGSTDSTVAICDRYSSVDYRFTVLHKKNGGVSSARNMGLSHARGVWVTFVDSDDKLADGALGRILCAIDAGKDMVVENVIMSEVSGNSFPVLPSRINSFEEMFGEALCGFVCNKVYKRDIIKKYEIQFDESLSFFEDWLFVGSYCSVIKDFDYIKEPCYIEYLPFSYAEKYGALRDFQHMILFYSKLKRVNKPMSHKWVDSLVMTLLCEVRGPRGLCEKVSTLKNDVGKDIRYAKGLRKFGIRLLAHSNSITIWHMIFSVYYLLKCY